MQGQQGAVGSLAEVIGFDHGSTSSDAGLDQRVFWSSIGSSAQNQFPDFMVASSDTNSRYVSVANHNGQSLGGWDFGESSSRMGQNEISQNGQKAERGWSPPVNVCTGGVMSSEIQQYEPSNVLSTSNVNASLHRDGSQDANGTLLLQNFGSQQLSQDLNMNSDVDEDDDCQVLEFPHLFKSCGSRNHGMPFTSSSAFASSSSDPFGVSTGGGGYLVEESDGRPGCSSDSRRVSCKRKALEGNSEQASGGGSTSYIQHDENSLCHVAPARNSASGSLSIDGPVETSFSFNLSEQLHHGSSVAQVACEHLPLSGAPGVIESSRRNFRVRMNATHQQGSTPTPMSSTETGSENTNVSSAQPSSRLLPRRVSMDNRPASTVDNLNPEDQPVAVHVSSLRRNLQSRWNTASGLRSRNSSNYPVSGERTAASIEAPNSAGVSGSISDYPIFYQPNETRSSLQGAPNWGLASGAVDNPGNVASTSRVGAGARAHSSTPSWSRYQSPSQNPRRLPEHVRRSLLSAADTESGGQHSSSTSVLSGPSSSSPETPLTSGSSRQGRISYIRSAMLLDRHLDGAIEIPYSLRTLGAASDGRSRLVSEIRSVLDLVRRGEGLRFEDVMILDQSVLGMPDIHDRHRDMRLDVDNMSYEELLALEERIGNVSTGLSEEIIVKQMQQRKHVSIKMAEVETEPCCICQEEYKDGQDLGTLDCGHDFHVECVKQWLMHKNICPICKKTGLTK